MNEFRIDQNNAIVKEDRVYVSPYVIAVCHDFRYICVKQVNGEKGESGKIDRRHPDYFIFDTWYKIRFGPFTLKEFDVKLLELDITNISGWETYE